MTCSNPGHGWPEADASEEKCEPSWQPLRSGLGRRAGRVWNEESAPQPHRPKLIPDRHFSDRLEKLFVGGNHRQPLCVKDELTAVFYGAHRRLFTPAPGRGRRGPQSAGLGGRSRGSVLHDHGPAVVWALANAGGAVFLDEVAFRASVLVGLCGRLGPPSGEQSGGGGKGQGEESSAVGRRWHGGLLVPSQWIEHLPIKVHPLDGTANRSWDPIGQPTAPSSCPCRATSRR